MKNNSFEIPDSLKQSLNELRKNYSRTSKMKEFIKAFFALLIGIPLAIITMVFIIYIFAKINGISSIVNKFKNIEIFLNYIIVAYFLVLGIGTILLFIGLGINWLIVELKYIKVLKQKDQERPDYENPHK